MPHPHRRSFHRPDDHDFMDADLQHPGVLLVDLDALARNYRKLCAAAAPARCAAVVKAEAYGLGVGPVAARLAAEGCTAFFVATLAEALDLRRLLSHATIYVLEGVGEGEHARFAGAALIPVLNSLPQIECWRRAGGGPAVLHIDTGMSRLGLSDAEVARLAAQPSRLAGLHLDHVMTHLACADTPAHRLNLEQLQRFEALRSKLPAAPTSIGNSACIFLGPSYCGDLARPGIGIYGGNPFSDHGCPVEPVVALRGRILQLREVAEATTVGYGATYVASPPCRLALCAIGYADGYPRAAGNRCAASFKGRRVPVVGRVSMDLTCVDVSALDAEDVAVGDYVDFIGGAVTLDEVAQAAGTISYEILTGFGPRLRRQYIGISGHAFGGST